MGSGIDRLAEHDYHGNDTEDDEELFVPHGYMVTTTTTKVERRFVRYAEIDERWDNLYRAADYPNRGERIEIEVTPCPHGSTSGNAEPLVEGGLVSLMRHTCEDCGEELPPEVEHEAYYKSDRPFFGDPDRYFTMTFGWVEEKYLAHI